MWKPLGQNAKNKLTVVVGDRIPKISARLRHQNGELIDLEGHSVKIRLENQSTGAEDLLTAASVDQKGDGFNPIIAITVALRVVTIQTKVAHSLSVGDRVYLEGLDGTAGVLNGRRFIVKTVPTTDTFTLDAVDGATVGAFNTSGVVVTRGQVSYELTATETLAAGLWWVAWERDDGSGLKQLIPPGNRFEFEVVAK